MEPHLWLTVIHIQEFPFQLPRGLMSSGVPEKGLIAPDLVVYLDILPEEATRIGSYGIERYEQLEFQKKVAQYYQNLNDATRKVIDVSLPVELIESQIQELALESIESCQKRSLSSLWLDN